MNLEEKFSLLKQNAEEIITEEALKDLLKKKKSPIVYCGYEPSGPLHLGHFVTITKLMDFSKAGFKVKILLADIHAMLNKKGSEEFINKEVKAWEKTIKAIGLKCEIVLGSSFQYKKKYQFDIMKLAQATTINRGLRSMQEIARDVENATISQLLYPIMQVADIKHLEVDVALGGLEQRKVHMIGKDLAKELDYSFIPFHTALITSLKGPGEKMSKSLPGSGISVTDSYDEIKKTIKGAYCPEKVAQDNPILQIASLILFPHLRKLKISRPEKFGGNLSYENYKDLESNFIEGKLHPLDLKTAVAEALEKIISPIRNNFK
ncbi:MAG: tyrosine--tRNA ligase [Nanoarchaeota archaeon]|nr:tyrosine--tRNA ligase [Nanoarchaeota archaeon]